MAPMIAEAQTVNQRLHMQHLRIKQGAHSGELTRGEAGRVRSADHRIHRSEERDRKTDHGHLTAGESRRLQGRLNRNSNRIYRLKHNRIVRPK